MEWYNAIPPIILGIIMSFLTFKGIQRDIKAARNEIPYGKDFKKEFSKVVEEIAHAYKLNRSVPIPCWVNGVMFKVRVEKLDEEHLDCSQVYNRNSIYINDELVARQHKIHYNYRGDYNYFEFTDKRDTKEIVEIIREAQKPAKEIHHNRVREFGLYPHKSKSYFEESSNGNSDE